MIKLSEASHYYIMNRTLNGIDVVDMGNYERYKQNEKSSIII